MCPACGIQYTASLYAHLGDSPQCTAKNQSEENAKLRAEVVALKQTLEAENGCHLKDMKHLVERTRERDAALLQLRVLRKTVEKLSVTYQAHNGPLPSALIDAWADVNTALRGPGLCCEGYAKHCDAHSVGCLYAEKRKCVCGVAFAGNPDGRCCICGLPE
jgi:hypothetical protein